MKAKTTETVKVLFRRWRGKPNTVIALFPGIAADPKGNILSYEHIGQHGAADFQGVMGRTFPITEIQAKADGLYQELESRGYVLDVRMRWSNHWEKAVIS